MSNPALIVSQSGGLTPGLSALVAQDYEPVSTLVTDRAENGRYYLSPATVARIEERTSGTNELAVIVDGVPHPGQLVDLRARLQSISIVDKRRVAWDRLAGANPVAATRISLQDARITRRQAVDAQRGASTQGPSDTSGQVADSDERIQTLRDRLEQQQAAARRRVRTGHTAVDARIVLLGGVGAQTTPLWSELTGHEATAEVGLPARPATAQTVVGPHTVAVTDTPDILGDDGLPEWLENVVPGLVTAIAQSTCVLGVGEGHEALLQSVADRFDVSYRSLAEADAVTARMVLDDLLPSVTCAIRLPYGDDTQALVSDLYDRAVVDATEYDDAIYMRLNVARTAIDELRRQVLAVGGELKRLDTSESVDRTSSESSSVSEEN